MSISRKKALAQGFKDGIPIGLGYLAVAFTLGITAKNAGLNAFQGFIASLFTLASAGEYAGFNAILESVPYIELVIVTIVANARYLLMGCSLSQRISPDMKLGHRLGVGFFLTDEIFGISIARPGNTDPFYTYGAGLCAAPLWALGTALGIIMGTVLPSAIVSALSVAIYGMFLAIIIPPAKKNKVVLGLVLISFGASFLLEKLPFTEDISSGTRVIILTVVLSALAAIIFPHDEEDEGMQEAVATTDPAAPDAEGKVNDGE